MVTRKDKPETIFDKLRITKDQIQNSLDWFQKEIKALNRSTYQPQTLINDFKSRHAYVGIPGRMYLYKYDALHKDTLPYWDQYPLIFYIGPSEKPELSKTHFYGINLHYLPYDIRLKLLKLLFSVTNNDKMDATTRVRASYQILKNLAASHKLPIKNAIKMYRRDQMRSRASEINASQWIKTAMLPIEAFKKASKQKVFFDTRRKG